MAGSNRSFVIMGIVNFRVAGAPTYYPAHSKNGNNVDQRIVVRAIGNIPSKANGGQGTVLGFNVVAWGKLADTLARSMAKGKEFSSDVDPNVYKGQVFFKDEMHPERPAVAVYMDTDHGRVAVMTEKLSLRIKKIIFGADSAQTIAEEIQKAQRHQFWNVPGSEGAAAWKTQLDIRNAEQYNPSSAKFGHAIVRKIEGPGIGAFDPTKTRQTTASTAAAIQQALATTAAPQLPATPPLPTAAQVPAPAPAPSTAVVAGL
jgi:hypothetical protein